MPTKKNDDLGQAEVQEKVDAETEKGLHGVKVDPTPDEHYTVNGVLAGKPTPESDADHRADVATKLERRNQ
jgi:hypothetical protein